MIDLTTEAMEFALQQYAKQKTFLDWDPTAAMLCGSRTDEWRRGIALAARVKLDAASRTIDLRRASA